jgi:diacylglycerol O-acyltransferase
VELVDEDLPGISEPPIVHIPHTHERSSRVTHICTVALRRGSRFLLECGTKGIQVVQMSTFERLSGQDASFLVFETINTPMNVGGTSVYDGGSLVRPDGSVDVERIKALVAARLHKVPRYRQRLAFVPIENQPIWVDDERFDLDYHVRHVALPLPGTDEQLKGLSADILSRPLDRGRALWELWIVEGLPERRFASVTKAHHCMVDGVSGVDLASGMMGTEPKSTFAAGGRWRPRRPPSGVEVLRDDVLARLRLPFTLPSARGTRGVLRSEFGQRLSAVWQTVQSGLRGAANTPLNRPTGPHRRFEWLRLSLAEIKEVKNQLGGTVNDVVLSTMAGALQRFLKRRGVSATGLDFRVAVPVNVRTAAELHTPGNRVSVWLTELPVAERDPRRRLAAICERTAALKESGHALGTDVLMKFADWAGPAVVTLGARLAARMNPYNLIITNVPGPQFPLYLLDARLLQAYPLVPLFENQGLGIALFSYDGQMCWGFNADWDLLPDVRDLVTDVEAAFAELHEQARATARRARPAARRGAHGSARI